VSDAPGDSTAAPLCSSCWLEVSYTCMCEVVGQGRGALASRHC
jgi:hypothetical protein